MAAEDEHVTDVTLREGAIALAIALASGLIFVLTPYALVWISRGGGDGLFSSVSGFNGSLTLFFPIVQGFALGWALGPKKRGAGALLLLVAILCGLEIFGAWFFMREGVICLIIVSPLIIGMIGFGVLLGRWMARRKVNRVVQASMLPLVAILVFAESVGPAPTYSNAVTDSVVINAPPEYVWRYVVQYPENASPSEYWLWSAGLPRPIQSVADAHAVGATRLCKFTSGFAFEERITELVPNEVMTFDVTRQPDHPEVTGHFQFDRGQIRLERNPDGTTTIVATSWYRLFVRPAAYFDWWTADITRQVHFRVLNHMKGLAESDYQAAQAAAL